MTIFEDLLRYGGIVGLHTDGDGDDALINADILDEAKGNDVP